MNSDNVFSQFIDFIQELFRSLGEGYLFFGSTWDVIRYIADIALVAFLFYWILVFIRQTRAWQLIKGIIMILALVLVCVIAGLDMVGYLFNRFVYFFAILFIVLFQPELRRVLETVGVRSSGSIKDVFKLTDNTKKAELSSFVHEICSACGEMAKTYTGALILIERTTRLDELLTQENVVKYESTVTSSVLQSIFYKGAPMHDGGLLVRDGMIIAARCHVPLSTTMHSLEKTGTRHRAAVGASEMGDTIAVVVSEERGTISIALNGRLFEMKDVGELETNLSYLLGILDIKDEKTGLGKIISKVRRVEKNAVKPIRDIQTKEEGASSELYSIKTRETKNINDKTNISLRSKVIFVIISIVFSIGLWMYIQINNNPVISKTLNIPITYSVENMPENIEVSYPISMVEIEVFGRKNTISKLSAKDVVAVIDYSGIDNTTTGVVELPVNVQPANSNIYFRVEQQLPETVSVTVYSVS